MLVGIGAGALLLYLPVYAVRDFALPLGWDTPWYVYRADVVADLGIGPLDTAVRPGHPVLSAVLGSLTGLSGLQLQVVLPFVLVAAFALTLGGAAGAALGRERGAHVSLVAAIAVVLLGVTRLAGENLANLLHLILAVPAFLLLARFAADPARRRVAPFVGAVLLLVAAGLSHWLFLGVGALAVGLWAILALPSSRRARAGGTRPWRTESGTLIASGGLVGAAMAALIYPVLGSSFRTQEIGESTTRFLPKVREDLGAMWAPLAGSAALAGAVSLARGDRREGPATSDASARQPFLRFLVAWSIVCVGGLALAAITLDVPPHRFLMLLVAVPVPVAVAAAVARAARWSGRVRWAPLAVTCASVAVLAIPTVRWWYGPQDLRGPEQWFDPVAFEQARRASTEIDRLPPGEPVIFLVGPRGASGVVSTALKERTIRAAISPPRQDDVHIYPGRPAELLAGRISGVPDADLQEHNDPYARDALAVLRPDTPIYVLEALGAEEHRAAIALHGAVPIATGVAVLQGEGPGTVTPVEIPAVDPVPPLAVAVALGVLLLAMLTAAGLGWSRWFLGEAARPVTVLALAPAVGAGMLVLAGFGPARAGMGLGGAAGVVVFIVTAGAGLALARSARFRRAGAGAPRAGS